MTTERENARDLGDRYRISSDTYEEKVEELEQENKMKMAALLDTVAISERKNDIPVDQQVSGDDSVDDPKEEDSSGKRVPESSPPVVLGIAPNDSNASNLETATGSPTTSPTGNPTASPTKGPTASPSISPTATPTKPPTASPTGNPTVSPTDQPTTSPSASPSHVPTVARWEDDANTAPADAKKERKKQGPKKDAAKAPEATEDVAEKQEGPKKKAATVANAAKKESDVIEKNLPDGGSSARANVPVEENEYAPAGKLIISQSQEEVMNTITAANQSAQVANRPLGLPIYAWGVIGVGLLLGVVLGALIAKKRRREKSASVGPTSTSTKKRIAIDYGYGDDDSVDVEELSIVSDISSLSGGTFVVQRDRV